MSNTPQEHLYTVGQPYVAGKRNWREWAEYNFRGGQHELRMFYNNPTAEEVSEIREGIARFAIYPLHDVIFFCWKFGALPWSDTGYTIHLVDAEERLAPVDVGSEAERATLVTFLVDAKSGLIQALRFCTFSPAFTRALHAAIWAQMEKPFCGRAEIERQGQSLYSRYSSADIANKLAIAKCRGGE